MGATLAVGDSQTARGEPAARDRCLRSGPKNVRDLLDRQTATMSLNMIELFLRQLLVTFKYDILTLLRNGDHAIHAVRVF